LVRSATLLCGAVGFSALEPARSRSTGLREF